jgi:purine-binding chemotaxis protein CheW
MSDNQIDKTADTVMLVVFAAGNSLMAFDARSVGEVLRLPPIRKAHGAASYVMGVANLRGRIITVLDLEKKLGLPASEVMEPRLLVIEDQGGEAIGVYVPELKDVIQAETTELQSITTDIRGADPELFIGILRREDTLVALLDPQRALAVS